MMSRLLKHRVIMSYISCHHPFALESAAWSANSSMVGMHVPLDLNVLLQATIVLFDSYHKRCKVQYDDGEEEWLALPKQRFRWLLPRAKSAGCNATIQASMAALGAERIQPPNAASPASDHLQQAKHQVCMSPELLCAWKGTPVFARVLYLGWCNLPFQ